MYVEALGKVQCINHATKEVCDIEFKEKGWNGKNANTTIGLIKKQDGPETKSNPVLVKISGKFTESLSMVDLRANSQKEAEIWKAAENPEKYEWQYNFAKFTLQLNLLSDKLKEKLPHSDTRLRPD